MDLTISRQKDCFKYVEVFYLVHIMAQRVPFYRLFSCRHIQPSTDVMFVDLVGGRSHSLFLVPRKDVTNHCWKTFNINNFNEATSSFRTFQSPGIVVTCIPLSLSFHDCLSVQSSSWPSGTLQSLLCVCVSVCLRVCPGHNLLTIWVFCHQIFNKVLLWEYGKD